jgi:SET family sugar efflux transporter-like MFS transporter
VRMALTAGWVVGPVLGSVLAAYAGFRTMFVVVAVATLAQVIPLGRLRGTPPPSAPEHARSVKSAPTFRAMLPLLAFTALYICVYAGESVKYAYLPLYMSEQLHLAPSLRGAIIGIQPLVELALMPLAVIVGRRIGMTQLMAFAAACGVAANICFATTGTPAGLFAGQILMGMVWGVFAALGIIFAQRLLPTAVATASAIFLSSTAISSAIGGLAGGLGVAVIGLPQVFFIPASLAAIAVIGLVAMTRIEKSRQGASRV